jgi:hypothetical protein
MARIQVLPLTPVTVDSYTHTPFVLVIDTLGAWIPTASEVDHLKAQTGAQAVLVSEDPIDVATPLVLTDEQTATLTATLTQHQTTQTDPAGAHDDDEGWGETPKAAL